MGTLPQSRRCRLDGRKSHQDCDCETEWEALQRRLRDMELDRNHWIAVAEGLGLGTRRRLSREECPDGRWCRHLAGQHGSVETSPCDCGRASAIRAALALSHLAGCGAGLIGDGATSDSATEQKSPNDSEDMGPKEG